MAGILSIRYPVIGSTRDERTVDFTLKQHNFNSLIFIVAFVRVCCTHGCTVSCTETGTAARGSTQDTRKNHLAAVPVSVQDTVHQMERWQIEIPPTGSREL